MSVSHSPVFDEKPRDRLPGSCLCALGKEKEVSSQVEEQKPHRQTPLLFKRYVTAPNAIHAGVPSAIGAEGRNMF